MFVAINLTPSGTMISRADLLGFTDDQVAEIRANENSATQPELVARKKAELETALQTAAHTLFARLPEGGVQ